MSTGQVLEAGIGLDPLQELQAVHLGHHDVEEKQVELLGGQVLEEMLAPRRGEDVVAVLLEDPGQRPGERLIVVRHEDLGSEWSFSQPLEQLGIDVAATDHEPRSARRGRTRPARRAAVVTAPDGSTPSAPRRGGNGRRPAISSSVTWTASRTTPDDRRKASCRWSGEEAVGQARGQLERAGRPAASAAASLAAPAGSTPTTRTEGLMRGDGRGDPGDEAAAAHRHEDGLHVGPLLQDLEAAGSLPGDDVQVLVRRHHREPAPLRERLGAPYLLGERGARKYHLAALPPDPSTLIRGALRHDDDGVDPEGRAAKATA